MYVSEQNSITNRENIIKTFTQLRYIWFMKEPKNKLLYCFIPKNACTIYKTLLYAITNNKPLILDDNIEIIHMKTENAPHKPTPQFIADKLLHNNSWNTFVILRDPLERLVSGFNDKCIKDDRHWCEGLKTNDFSEFIQRILYKINNGNIMDINDHYRPQYTFCGMEKYFKYFDYVIYFNKLTIAKDTLAFMKSVSISEYYYKWGNNQNEIMFNTKTSHSSNKITNMNDSLIEKVKFYSKYYDKNLAIKVINAFQMDYNKLNITLPKWLNYL